jgi:transcriptional regulator with XRE-family HTH domain
MPLTEQRIRSEVEDLGARIKGLRSERGWTQDELASRSGLSKSYLSRLEDGERQPSIAALLSVATSFGVPLNELFGGGQESGPCGIVRADANPPRQGNGLVYRPLLSGDRVSNIQPIHVTVPAGRTGDERYCHDGEEWIYILHGSLLLTVASEKHTLHTGDSAHFDARLSHRLTALDGRDAEIILVACPLPRRLLSSYL